MDRSTWLKEIRRSTEEEKNAPFGEPDSPLDEELGYIGEGYYHILVPKK